MYIYTLVLLKGNMWERERSIPFSLFTTLLLITACRLSRCFCRARITVTLATNAQAYCRQSNSLNSFRKTLFDHSKRDNRTPRNSPTLERKSSWETWNWQRVYDTEKGSGFSRTRWFFFFHLRLTHRFSNSLVEQNRVDEFPQPFKRYLPALIRTSVNSEPGTL